MNASSLQESDTHLRVTVPLPDGFEESQAWLQQRIALCLTRSWPHVASLREAQWSDDGGSVELVYNVRGERLCDYLDRVRGESRKYALDQLPAQLLIALHSLHADGIAHGDLCADAIYVDEQEDGKLNFQIMHLATGGATARFGQAILPGVPCNEPAYWPPEAKDVRLEATPEGDMYALGIVLLEALKGKAAVKTFLSADGEVPARLAMAWPRPEGAQGAALRDLVASLVQDKAQRPTAEQAYTTWAKERHQSTWERKVSRRALEVALAVTGGICLLLLLGYYMRGAEVQRSIETVARLTKEKEQIRDEVFHVQRQMKTIEERAQGLIAANDALNAENDALKRRLAECCGGTPPPPLAEERAQSFWNDTNGAVSREKIETLKQSDPDAAKVASGWLTQLEILKTNAKAWGTSDDKLTALINDAIKNPWKSIEDTKARLVALEKAAKVWGDAVKEDQTLPGLDALIAAHANTEIGEILSQWRAGFYKDGRWTIELVSGRCPQGYSKSRIIQVWSGPESQRREWYSAHEWGSEVAHAYPPGTAFTISWKPGEPITVWMEDDGYSYNADLIDITIEGPMALWRLNRDGRVVHQGSELRMRVLRCPGPPPSVLKSLATSQLLQSS